MLGVLTVALSALTGAAALRVFGERSQISVVGEASTAGNAAAIARADDPAAERPDFPHAGEDDLT